MSNELKKAIDNAKTEEQKNAVMEKYKDELKKLSDEELKGVAGGGLRDGTPEKDGKAKFRDRAQASPS